MQKIVTGAVCLTLGTLLAAAPAGAQNREHQQMAADLRIVQEQNQQLRATVDRLSQVLADLMAATLGAHLRAVGEDPAAAASVGINVKRVQYIALLMSGCLASLGGLNLSMGYLTIFQTNMTAGRGFIALAAVFLGNKNPVGTVIAAIIFGAATALGAQLGTLSIPNQYVEMIPPFVTIAALVIYNLRRRAQMAASTRKFQERMTEKAV
jgi:simple sugar transport system permease protein